MEQRVSIITLGVRDLATSRAFYRALGWKEAPQSQDSVAFLQTGGVVLGLFGREDLAKDIGIASDGSGFPGIALAHNVREKGEVAPVLALAERAGGAILKPAQEAFWGGYYGYFADPDGFAWEVAWNPFFPFDEAGNLKLEG